MMPESDQHHKISSVCFRYQWTLSGQPLDYYDLDDITSTTDGTLLISRATLSHEGYYQCTARNDYGSALTKVTFLQLGSEYEIILGCRCLRERSFSRAYLFVGILHNLIIIIVSYFKANGTLSVLRYDFFSVRLKSVRFHPSSSFVAYGAVCSQLTLDFFLWSRLVWKMGSKFRRKHWVWVGAYVAKVVMKWGAYGRYASVGWTITLGFGVKFDQWTSINKTYEPFYG